ncbi:MAG: GMC family oxidoreductase N-terminal domain-containing protein [Pseudomonadota bacterium]
MDSADYVIVGGGTAGAVLAARLSENPRVTVALLEMGGPTRDWGSPRAVFESITNSIAMPMRRSCRSTTQAPFSGRSVPLVFGSGLGGTSAIGDGLYMRGTPKDYDGWAALGLPGWAARDVMPFFRRAEGQMRDGALQGGPLPIALPEQPGRLTRAFVEGARALGLPFQQVCSGAQTEAVGFLPQVQLNGQRISTAAAYLDGAADRENLAVLTAARVERVEIANGRAAGVAYRRGPRALTIAARREVILAAGSYHSPKLLMLSGIGNGEVLSPLGIGVVCDRPGVGQNLQDHLSYTIGYGGAETPAAPSSLQGLGRIAEKAFALGLGEPLRAEAGAMIRSTSVIEQPDLHVQFVVALLETALRRVPLHDGFTGRIALLQPRSRGSVTLAGAGPRSAPKIDPGFFSDRRDLRVMVHAARLLRRLLETHALETHRGEMAFGPAGDTEMEIEFDICSRAASLYDPVGTCAMGPVGSEERVTDHRLKVCGVDGLRVADASVMPTIPSAPTLATTVMIAEKAAQMIREDAGA